MPPLIDLTAQRFGRLLVLGRATKLGNQALWHCQCDCGNQTVSRGQQLRSGRSASCGCLNHEVVGQLLGAFRRTHARTGTPEWRSWTHMKDRCFNSRERSFANYGGRGIRVCERLRSFATFYAVLGDRPTGTTLDRPDNNGNYSCGSCDECQENGWLLNCRWATSKEQNQNRRPRRVHLN